MRWLLCLVLLTGCSGVRANHAEQLNDKQLEFLTQAARCMELASSELKLGAILGPLKYDWPTPSAKIYDIVEHMRPSTDSNVVDIKRQLLALASSLGSISWPVASADLSIEDPAEQDAEVARIGNEAIKNMEDAQQMIETIRRMCVGVYPKFSSRELAM